jgi:DnaK suppressor protein
VAEKRKKTPKTNDEQAPKPRLSAAELEHFQRLLLEKRRELLGNVSKIEGEALRQSRLDASGDLSSMPIHMADLGTDNFEQEFSLDLMDSERRLLVEMEDALHRIETGTFGICEGTGKPISKARLEAQPWARYSVEYAKMVEEGRVREGE